MRRALMMFVLLAGCAAAESGKDMDGAAGSDTAGVESVGARSDSVAVPDEASPRDGRPVLLIVGTSLTAGLGLDPAEAYPALLQQKADSAGLALRVVNAGLSGETSAGALRRIDWLLQQPADFVMIETGANDGLRGLDFEATRENLRQILRKVRVALPWSRLFLAQMEAPPNLGEWYTASFRDMYPAVARDEGAVLIPFLLDGVAGIPRLNQGDGIHPNLEGERIVAENVWRALAPVIQRDLRSRPPPGRGRQ